MQIHRSPDRGDTWGETQVSPLAGLRRRSQHRCLGLTPPGYCMSPLRGWGTGILPVKSEVRSYGLTGETPIPQIEIATSPFVAQNALPAQNSTGPVSFIGTSLGGVLISAGSSDGGVSCGSGIVSCLASGGLPSMNVRSIAYMSSKRP